MTDNLSCEKTQDQTVTTSSTTKDTSSISDKVSEHYAPPPVNLPLPANNSFNITPRQLSPKISRTSLRSSRESITFSVGWATEPIPKFHTLTLNNEEEPERQGIKRRDLYLYSSMNKGSYQLERWMGRMERHERIALGIDDS